MRQRSAALSGHVEQPHQHAYALNGERRLRERHKRPSRSTTNQRYELAPSHSITSVARVSIVAAR